MANNLVKHGNEFNAVLPPHGSVAAEIQALLWRSRVCTAFHLVPAAEFAELDHEMESDVVVLGDDDEAKGTVMEITQQHPEPPPARRRLAAQRGRHGDVRGGAADDQHPAQDARQPAPQLGVNDDIRLHDRVVIVTGASRGIGKGLALGLAQLGATVVCAARTVEETPRGLPGTIHATVDAIKRGRRHGARRAVRHRCRGRHHAVSSTRPSTSSAASIRSSTTR